MQSRNQWESVSFGKEGEDNKFRRLMGIGMLSLAVALNLFMAVYIIVRHCLRGTYIIMYVTWFLGIYPGYRMRCTI